ncbi:nucleotidyltransferase family protein [Aquimarina sp. MMG016]|uniref:nucleotidyltransferase family protein n=1 Tax=Aquimarina sp. MMG016 TaxID=2822690 RepID=UPI001B3A0877|nr:nucleotidyltransferase family protein [Aquimarina sp. MMG016]MBQ4822535.1 nucleotidyltransferase family protein [Aquimarina sp. MMG016]
MPILQNHKIAHLILAAGSSSRLGRPKQLLPWKGLTLIEHAIAQSLQLDQVSTYVVLGAYFDLIQKEIDDFPLTIVYNNDWKSGMGSSISFGIKSILQENSSYDAVLISLVDQPLLEAEHLSELISEFVKKPDQVIATGLSKRVGVPAIFPSSYFEELSKLKEDFGARYILKQYKEFVDVVSDSGKGIDIDTLEQYQILSKNNT